MEALCGADEEDRPCRLVLTAARPNEARGSTRRRTRTRDVEVDGTERLRREVRNEATSKVMTVQGWKRRPSCFVALGGCRREENV